MKKYIAKSNGETLIEHTNNLLDEFNLLKITYPRYLMIVAGNYYN